MNIISHFDNLVKKKIYDPRIARHHSIQNEIIYIMSNMIINNIFSEINESMYFPIMVDETKDIRKTEQLSIVVRYYYKEESKERFLDFTPLKDLNVNALFNHIKFMFSNCKIDIKKCIAQMA